RGLARAAVLHELQPDHQAEAAHVAEALMAGETLPARADQVLSHPGRVVDQAAFEQPERGEAGGRRDGVSAEGGAVAAVVPLHHLLAREELARAAHARLTIGGDEQYPVLAGQGAKPVEEAGMRPPVAALALHGFD